MSAKKLDTGSANRIQQSLDSLYELFHENTKIHPSNEAQLGIRIGAILRSPDMKAMMAKGYNQFPHLPRVELPREVPPTGCSLEEAIRQRRSVRDFAAEPLDLQALNQLLALSYGITGAFEFGGGNIQQVRAAPSAGGLYPIELYILVERVTDLEPGVYHYNVPDHALERMPDPPDLAGRVETVSHYKSILTGAAALFVLTAVFDRNTFKYGDRGYRFILLDAGHLAQNLLLVSAALGLGAVPIGGFRDDQLSRLVGADGVNEAALYLIPVGHPTPQAAATGNRQRALPRGG